MITELSVKDLGVFADTRVVFGDGLVALTGETGAGKSLVVGAIQLLLGARADAGVVRPGATEAIVDGRFVDEGGVEVVLTRVVPVEGRSRAYVDGRPVTVAELTTRGLGLVELHGQHAHQQLLQAQAQRESLDRFAGVDLGQWQEARRRIADIDARLAELGGDERTRAREMSLLEFQLGELEDAGLDDPDEDVALDRDESVLADAVAHRDAGSTAAEALVGDDGVVSRLSDVVGVLAGRTPFADIDGRLRSVLDELTEAGHDVRRLAETIDDDPERLADLRERRQLLADLRRKYGESLAEVIEERDGIAARLDDLRGHDRTVAALGDERAIAVEQATAAAAVVAKARRAAAPVLAGGVQARLRDLAMPAARVEVAVDGPDPADDVRFLLAANLGGTLAPMAKVASGGELSRATLALRLELTAAPPSLVFDEVDAGIGGEAAWAVGAALGALADRHQIFVVTHLPQVAAFADQHVTVRKAADGTVTTADAETLDDDARVGELARMLSGRPDSESGRAHARELLDEAAARQS